MLSRFPNALAMLLSFAALLYLFSGHLKFDKLSVPRLAPLVPEQGSALLSVQKGFAENSVYRTVESPRIGQDLKRYGSWMQSDASTGRAESAWFPYVPEFSLLVAGQPKIAGCALYIETQSANGSIDLVGVPGDDPDLSWQVRTVRLSRRHRAVRFRIIAIDAATGPGGWLGFSQPFEFVNDLHELAKQAVQVLLVSFTAAASLVAVLFPGLCLRRLVSNKQRHLALLWIPVPGFLMLALVGLLCWVGPTALGVRRIAQCLLVPLFVYAFYHLLLYPLTNYFTKMELRVFLVILLLTALGVSKACYSVGPIGELFGGKISRALEVGDRSDSRIPYYVIQLIATRSDSDSVLAATLFGDWGFSSRTPLVAFAASPIVLAIPVRPPTALPELAWTVFDPEGFAAYRIVMIVFACCSLIATFGVARLFVDEQWAFLAFLVTVTAPFVLHEIYFTWPKLEAAWFVFIAVYLIVRGRFLWAGMFWGIAYLCHPLALLSAPALLSVVFLVNPKLKSAQLTLRAVSLAPGLALCMAIWIWANRRKFYQTIFLTYLRMADAVVHPTLHQWLLSRWVSVANTLLPLYLFVLHSDHHSINSVMISPSPAIVHFYFQYWNTLPFGVGIVYFGLLSRFLFTAYVEARGWLLLVFVLPFAFFAVYWGVNSAGMLREGLHPWVLGLLVFSVVMWRKIAASHLALSAACCVALLLRGGETLLMLLLPAMRTSHRLLSAQFVLSDSLALLTMCAAVVSLYVITFRHARSICPTSLRATKENGN